MTHSDTVVGKSLYSTLHAGEDVATDAVLKEIAILLLCKEIQTDASTVTEHGETSYGMLI